MQNIQAMDLKRFVTILCVMILFVPSAVFSQGSTESTPNSLSASTADSSTPALTTTHTMTTEHDITTEHEITTHSSGELGIGGNCSDSVNTYCKNDTICDEGICKSDVGGNCTDTDNCTSGTICDKSKCNFSIGSNCSSNSQACMSGTTCIKDVCHINVGGTCNTTNEEYCIPGTQCDGKTCKFSIGSNCSSNNQACVSGTTCIKDVCHINVGGTCNTTNEEYCIPGTQCDGKTCNINVGGTCNSTNEKYCISGTQCDHNSCRLVYGHNCSASSDYCKTSLNCTLIEDKTQLCLCPVEQFRNNEFCENVTKLRVDFTQGNDTYKEDEVTVEWTTPNFPHLNFTYVVNTSDELRQVNQSQVSVLISNRTAGSVYLITITTQVKKDPTLSNMTEQAVSASREYYTKPATPGNLTQTEYTGPDVTLHFNHSKGGVQQYIVRVLDNTYTFNKTNGQHQDVLIQNLTEGICYNVTIHARIARNDRKEFIDSGTLTTMFCVKANKSGAVSNFNLTRKSSRWAEVSWSKPINPKGEIIGYTFYAKRDGNCILSVLAQCINCSRVNTTENCNRTESKNYPKDQPVITVNATDLKPAINYTMTVFAHNEVGEGETMDLIVTTDEEAAQNIYSVNISAPDENMLNVIWTPGEYTGVTTYFVTWAEETSLGSDNYSQKGNKSILNYNIVSMKIDHLISFWNYAVTVQASTAKGHSPNATRDIYRTKDSQPGEVKDFEIIQPEKSAQKLDLIVQCPEERNRNGNITSYSVTYSIIGTENSSRTDYSASDPYCSNNVNISINVTAEKDYSISVSANTVNHIGIPKNKTKYIDPKEPELTKRPDGFPPFVDFDKTNTNNTAVSVIVKLCTCLVNDNQGAITLAGIIICKMVDPTDCEPEPGKHEDYYRATNLTWAYYNKNTNSKRYRTTPDTFHQTIKSSARRRRRSLLEPHVMSYAVGNDSSCDSSHQDEFCNGHLMPSTKYKTIVFACTRGGCSESQAIVIETNSSPNGTDVGAIVGGIFGALAVIAIIVLVLFLYRRYQRKDDFVEIDAPHKTIVRKPVKLKHFAEHLERLHRDSNLLFQEEFEEVQENSPKNYSTDAATLDANKVKNRYVNILSFDHTRVKLITDDGDPSTDFINANYIPGYSSPREYIATQGPMVSTVADMWRMMWEQNSSIIVMLSDLTEKGRPKVDMYWPNELNSPVQYGNVIVDMTACSTLNTYTIRNFTISMENGNEKRRVTQYFFPGWEDYGANVSPEDLLDFVKAVRQEATSKPEHGPITVHCSAGVGRTGTFIALDFLMQFVNDNSLDAEVDIYNLVLNMRHHRPMMVQSEKQYIFVHDALKLIIENKIKAMKEQNEDNIYQNTTSDNIYANQAFEPEDENLYENTNKLGQPTTTL